MLFRKTVGFVAWGFCENRRQWEDQTLAPQTLHPPSPPVCQVFEGLGLSFLQDVLRPTLMPGLLELPTQSCPLGATSGLAGARAGRGDTTMDTAISSCLRLTPGIWAVPGGCFPSVAGNVMVTTGTKALRIGAAFLPDLPDVPPAYTLNFGDIAWCWSSGQLSTRGRRLLFHGRESQWPEVSHPLQPCQALSRGSSEDLEALQ